MYLGDTGMIQDKHSNILWVQEVPDLIAVSSDCSKIRSTDLPTVDANNTMDNYD